MPIVRINCKWVIRKCISWPDKKTKPSNLHKMQSVSYTHLDVYKRQLLQPYIENAIRHGLLHQKGEKKIAVYFDFDENKKRLTCSIEDNGIGRNASSAINKNRKQLHESFSTSANAKRLDLLNQNRDDKIGVVYEDLNVGTRVTVTVPVNF